MPEKLSLDKVSQIPVLYWEDKKTIREIALFLAIGTATVNRYLPKKRSFTEAQQLRQILHPALVKTGRIQCKSGYVLIYKPDYYKPMNKTYVYEHRLVWETVHQQRLPLNWIVHHSNGIKDDNRPDNLVAYPKGKHKDVIPLLAEHIRALEVQIRLLQNSLSQSHLGAN